jgi:hypothetical protein
VSEVRGEMGGVAVTGLDGDDVGRGEFGV